MQHPPMDKPCDTCGSERNREVIVCCCRCNRARKHIYCMRVHLLRVPDEWSCDECLLNNDRAPLEGGVKEESTRSPFFKSKKCNETAKVKLLSYEDVQNLSSGAAYPKKVSVSIRHVPPRRSFPTSKPGPSSGMASKFSTPFSGKVVTPKFFPSKVKVNPSSIPSGCLKPPRKGCEQIRPVTNRQQSQILNELGEPKAIATSVTDNICNEGPLTSFTLCKETGTSNTNTEMALHRGVHHSVPEFKNSSIEERGPLNFIPYLLLPYLPAQDVTWRGGFKIHAGELYDGFLGRPPFRVKHETYKFSKAMYPVLEVKFVPRGQLLTNLFHNYNPDFRDIGLYILPSDLERSKDKACLFELMEKENVAMETCINGVELLIFTSTNFHVNSELSSLIEGITELDHNRFLWGVFRRGREDEDGTACESSSPVEGGVRPDDETVDMEIDMMGGVIVGSVDVPVPRESSSTKCCLKTLTESYIEKVKQEFDISPGVLQSSIEQLKQEFGMSPGNRIPRKVKSEPGVGGNDMDVPPGYEQVLRQNSSSFLQKADEKYNPPLGSVKKEKMNV